ncbi:hypothetical protein HPB50_003554 [Hyalomma asiaticum]|uniref:Uncharacterized protein n=1 Tax=Hyalomma asiaticum TaxID=266040 RepID=A0ACB7SYD4_HYAAI|nr:hypothetical protein HPB50_003554 [Hyalomma asiaticum]
MVAGELQTEAPAAGPNNMPEFQEPADDNPNMDTSVIEDDAADQDSVELQQPVNDNPNRDTSVTRDDAADQDSVELHQPVNDSPNMDTSVTQYDAADQDLELHQPENGTKEHTSADCSSRACALKRFEDSKRIADLQKCILQLQKQNVKLEEKLDAAMSRCLTLRTLDTPKNCMYYTGLPNVEVFHTLLEYFAQRAKEMVYWGIRQETA